jgi:hypothetical protein
LLFIAFLKRSRKIIGEITLKKIPAFLEKKLRAREKVEIYYVNIFGDRKRGKIIWANFLWNSEANFGIRKEATLKRPNARVGQSLGRNIQRHASGQRSV